MEEERYDKAYKKARALRKKLRQIDDLEEKLEQLAEEAKANGHPPPVLNPEQADKVQKRTQVEEEVAVAEKELLEAEALRDAAEAARQLEEKLEMERRLQEANKAAAKAAKKAAKSKAKATRPVDHPNGTNLHHEHCQALLPHRHSASFYDDPLGVEDISVPPPKKPERSWEFLEEVSPNAPEVRDNEEVQRFLNETSLLSVDAFDEDCCKQITKKSKWRLTLLVTKLAANTEEQARSLIGFIVWRIQEDLECFSIAKTAVAPAHRRKGFGTHLVKWAMQRGKRGKVSVISLSSVPDAISFYQRLGFERLDDIKLKTDPNEELVEGQVYMELALRRKKRR